MIALATVWVEPLEEYRTVRHTVCHIKVEILNGHGVLEVLVLLEAGTSGDGKPHTTSVALGWIISGKQKKSE